MRFDVLVLGGGIVGVAQALDLVMRGKTVGLVEKGSPGAATSFGNAGLIQSEAMMPYPFPRDPVLLLQYALKLKPEANYHFADILKVAPFLYRYFRASTRAGQLKTAAANYPLFSRCLAAHERLADAAGVTGMLRPGGWIKAFRDPKSMDDYLKQTEIDLKPFGVTYDILDRKGLQEAEPHLSDAVIGAVRWATPYSVNDPEALTLAYAKAFEAKGGRILKGDAMTLAEEREGWSVKTAEGLVSAPDCIVALGPWAPDLMRSMGYFVPMGVKRGYHIHMRTKGNATLNLPVLDADAGYMLAPMARGIRLTSGAEFADRDSPETPMQIDKIEPYARQLLPLESRVEAKPWMGSRPCMPDMISVMGKAPRHKGLWLNFGHAHHGLTLAGVSARLVGEMITGEKPFTDPAPYSLTRFG